MITLDNALKVRTKEEKELLKSFILKSVNFALGSIGSTLVSFTAFAIATGLDSATVSSKVDGFYF